MSKPKKKVDSEGCAFWKSPRKFCDLVKKLQAELDALEKENQELREALPPVSFNFGSPF